MTDQTAEVISSSGIHEPHCNTFCMPAGGWHYLTDGVGLPHLHRTDMSDRCGACHATSTTSEAQR